jgi:hypothetical protein
VNRPTEDSAASVSQLHSNELHLKVRQQLWSQTHCNQRQVGIRRQAWEAGVLTPQHARTHQRAMAHLHAVGRTQSTKTPGTQHRDMNFPVKLGWARVRYKRLESGRSAPSTKSPGTSTAACSPCDARLEAWFTANITRRDYFTMSLRPWQ